jgi:FkbM family methyltransferase
MNFSSIPNDSLLGKLLRLPLKLLPGGMVLPVMQGPLKGMRWIVGAGDHGYWLGSYELDFQRQFAHTLKPGQVVLDIGAHVGFYTLLASRLVGPGGSVHAFEPLPRNMRFIERHIEINHLQNVTLHESAVSDRQGLAWFGSGSSNSTGRLTGDGQFNIQVTSLDALYEEGVLSAVDAMKIDVEGAEYHVLSGGLRMLETQHPVIFLATHGREPRKRCLDLLTSLSYRLRPINAPEIKLASEFIALPGSID